MPDIVKERLELIIEHAQVIEDRVTNIHNADELRETATGLILLDSLITRLQALAENIKKIQKIAPLFFKEVLPYDVNPVIRFRDLVSHHYELLNHEIVFAICKAEVPVLREKIQAYLTKN